MATTSIHDATNARTGQRLLIDTGRMTVRRVTRAESTILAALKALPPGERATLAAMVDVLSTKRRKGRAAVAVPAIEGGEA